MRNLVVCCDGTGNEIGENISNVLKLYRVLRKTDKTSPRQIVFYDPGVGTLARPNPWTKFKQDTVAVFGLMTGYGLDDNVLRAYEFLINNYQDGDDMFLFGFSRGAHTVRILAGLIHKIGLLAPEQRNLADAALTAYKQASSLLLDEGRRADIAPVPTDGEEERQDPPASRDDPASQFARIVSSRWPIIKFVGVWDTVASIIVPRPDRPLSFSIQNLAFTRSNPSVRVFRQAAAIDERRRMFRLEPWVEPQIFTRNRFSATTNPEPQDALQVWFAGVHADIGGGYPERESGLSKFPLLWMIQEATKCGLMVSTQTANHLVRGVQRQGSPFRYVAPDIMQAPHRSLTGAWHALEWIPKADQYKEWKLRRSRYGCYIPAGEPRAIPEGAHIHESVLVRMKAVPAYSPINLPGIRQIIS